MQTPAIQAQLGDLPTPFKPGDPVWLAVMNSFLAAMNAQGGTTDALIQQLSFPMATGKWLTFWGLFFGIPRFSGESDAFYANRIELTILGWASTVAGVGAWIEGIFNVPVAITENIPSQPGYSIIFDFPLSANNLTAIASGLSRIRPAGVPFLPFLVASGGLFLGTEVFLGMSFAPGAYLGSGSTSFSPSIGLTTNAWSGNIPVNYFNLPNNFNT